MAGRPRKPVHIKKAQGTLEKSREVDNPISFEPLSRIPDIPGIIPDEGGEYFIYCCKILLSIGLLTAAYIPSLTRAAIWYSYMVRAVGNIEKEDYFQKTQSGYTAKNAHIVTFEDAHKHLESFESKYGFDLVSSQKLSMPNKKKESDYFD